MNIKNKNLKNHSLNTIPLSSLIKGYSVYSDKLMKMGLFTVQDLLLYFPLRYEDRTHFCFIKNLFPGNYAMVKGKILNCNITSKEKRIMTCQISDGSGILTLRFFNFNTIMKNSFIIGKYILVYGVIKCGKYNFEMNHPEYCIKDNVNDFKLQKTLTPIYPAIKGIKQNTIRKFISRALNLLETCTMAELLPSELSHSMMSLPEAFRILHYPSFNYQSTELEYNQYLAQQRLVFEELLAYHLNRMTLCLKVQRHSAQTLPIYEKLKAKLLASLPFNITNAQMRVISEIEHDMKLSIPMMRLLQGDVGSGKTLVAAIAALYAIAHNKQVALMVPTELLAEQHANSFRNWFTSLGIRVECLVGNQKKEIQSRQRKVIADGQVKMVIGTHAIIQKKVNFNCLMLVIIDEQHRFGVHQRLTLWEKGLQRNFYPHYLIMTATPIPRTLAMTIYANLDISTINELPSGRIPTTTIVLPNMRRGEIFNRLRNACIHDGRQAYWICTLIKQSKLSEVQAVEKVWEELKSELPELKIGLIHGRMKLLEKNTVIQNFKYGQLNLLVATTLIEVGIDVPNASLMVIENSDRLGLTQLHQIRGRVGRGSITSYCILLYKSPLSEIARRRLQVLRESNDGFFIAQKDLEIRGPGNVFGIRQTGNSRLKFANLLRDKTLIPKIHCVAHYIYKNYPEKAAALIERWISKTERYFNV